MNFNDISNTERRTLLSPYQRRQGTYTSQFATNRRSWRWDTYSAHYYFHTGRRDWPSSQQKYSPQTLTKWGKGASQVNRNQCPLGEAQVQSHWGGGVLVCLHRSGSNLSEQLCQHCARWGECRGEKRLWESPLRRMTPWWDETDNRGIAVKVTLCLGGRADICVKKNYITHYAIHESPSCQWTLLRWGKRLMVFFGLLHIKVNVTWKHTDLGLCPLWSHKGRGYHASALFLSSQKLRRFSWALVLASCHEVILQEGVNRTLNIFVSGDGFCAAVPLKCKIKP